MPMTLERFRRSICPARLSRYPECSASFRTDSRISGEIRGDPRSAIDTAAWVMFSVLASSRCVMSCTFRRLLIRINYTIMKGLCQEVKREKSEKNILPAATESSVM